MLPLSRGVRAAPVMSVTQLAAAACDKDLENHLRRIRVQHIKVGAVAEEWKMHGGLGPPAVPRSKGRGVRGHSQPGRACLRNRCFRL